MQTRSASVSKYKQVKATGLLIVCRASIVPDVFSLMADLFPARIILLLLSITVLPAAAAPLRVPLRVNCGGGTIKDKKTRTTWLEDKRFLVSGKKYRFVEEPSLAHAKNPAPASVYPSVRRADVAYSFSGLPDGDYLVRLHFMDAKTGVRRLMNFDIEGTRLVRDLDVRKVAGGLSKACVIEVIAVVRDGNGLEITGDRGTGDDVFISAIEILAAPPGSVPPADPAEFARRLRAFAGGPARLVWARAANADDFYSEEAGSELVGYDSEDGGGERRILAGPRSFAKPLLSDDGRHVIFTDHQARRCYAVRWDGGGLREIANGFAADVWTDPASGQTWVYVRAGWHDTSASIIRHRLDDPAQSEPVWSATANGWQKISWFQVGGDGRHAVDALPWPRIGLMGLAGDDFKIVGSGCWPGIAPDDSGRMFYFQGTHTALAFLDQPRAARKAAKPREIALDTVPGWTGHKVYHPRWTNHPRYLTATAPQWMPQTELYLGRFDKDYTAIEEWFRLTRNEVADYYGDAVLAALPAASRDAAPAGPTPPPAVEPGPSAPSAGLVFLWDHERAKNVVTGADGKVRHAWSAKLEGRARPGRWFGAQLQDGALVPSGPAGEVVMAAARTARALTLVMDLAPHSIEPAAGGVIACLGRSGAADSLLVEQIGPALAVSTAADQPGGSRPFSIAGLAAGHSHWVVVIEPERWRAWRDGALVMDQQSQANFSAWDADQLLFGNDTARRKPWSGGIEHIAILGRALAEGEIKTLAAAHAARWAERKPASRTEVEAELLALSPPPDLAKLAPYTRSLAENHYRVRKVLSGELAASEIILLEWSVLGGALVPPPVQGTVRRLVIEPVEEHPELDGEHRTTEILDPTLPLFHDPSA